MFVHTHDTGENTSEGQRLKIKLVNIFIIHNVGFYFIISIIIIISYKPLTAEHRPPPMTFIYKIK